MHVIENNDDHALDLVVRRMKLAGGLKRRRLSCCGSGQDGKRGAGEERRRQQETTEARAIRMKNLAAPARPTRLSIFSSCSPKSAVKGRKKCRPQQHMLPLVAAT
jgi:hypothetical protein